MSTPSWFGIGPPPEVPHDQVAAWYYQQVQDAAKDYTEWSEVLIDELVMGAIQAGVIGHRIPVAGFTQPQPLSSLLAPYRTREGGLAEREEAARQRVLDAGPERWNRG